MRFLRWLGDAIWVYVVPVLVVLNVVFAGGLPTFEQLVTTVTVVSIIVVVVIFSLIVMVAGRIFFGLIERHQATPDQQGQ